MIDPFGGGLPDANTAIAALDLVAQQSMAWWTKLAVIAAFASLLISGAALAALLRSLYQTDKALRDTRWLGELQTQAYVQATHCEIQAGREIILTCTNFGQSPATHFSVNAIAQRVKTNEVVASIKSKCDDFQTWTAISPGQDLTVRLKADDDLVYELSRGQFNDDEALLVSGSIIYCTVYNIDHRTDFAFFSRSGYRGKFSRPPSNLKAFWRIPDREAPAAHSPILTPWSR